MSKKARGHKGRQSALLEKPLSDFEDSQPKAKSAKLTFPRPGQKAESSDDEGDDREARSWGISTKEEPSGNALPYMTTYGKWKASSHSIKITGAEDAEDAESLSEVADEEADEEADEKATPKKSFAEIKVELATMAIAITEETEENVGKLKEMLKYMDLKQYDVESVRLALLSFLAVIKDILPGYYIRPLSDVEKTATVSKDIRKTRDFEQTILASYRKFLEILKSIIFPAKGRRLPKRLLPILHIALTCVHEMILFANHFNHFEDLLKLATRSLLLPWEGEVQQSCDALKKLFASDDQGEPTMLTLRLLSNIIKDKGYNCPVSWLGALETVRIKSNVAGRATNPKGVLNASHGKKHLSGKQKKDLKAKKEELAKLAEAEAIVSREDLNKWNSESLRHLFRIYFGVLKHAPTADLLPPILAGLARHSHRIGVEYFTDLLQALKRLLERTDQRTDGRKALDLIPALHCILTIDRIYSINENLAGMDFKFFYNALYHQLGLLVSSPQTWDWDKLQAPLQHCISSLFHPKRHVPALRVAAFTQRLGDLALAFLSLDMAGPATFALENIKTLLTHHNRAAGVLDREPFGQGAYLTDCDDPDLCNPYSRSLYEVLQQCQAKDQLQQKPAKPLALIQSILKLAPQ